MKEENSSAACSFCNWYPKFKKNSLKAAIIAVPKDVCKYLEDDAFLLPVEATNKSTSDNTEWHDGTIGEDESDEEMGAQPTFPAFSEQIQEIIDEFGAVFIKTNWSSPWDATWVAPTKTLKCRTLEEVYLLLKSSNKISQDLNIIKKNNSEESQPCLVLKRWRDIDPCQEFRCFVINKELVGICQRDASQYYKYIENEKYDIQRDIKSLFLEKVKDQFTLHDYSFDVIRFKKDLVKIVDFGALDESVTKRTLFTYEELQNITETPEFRFIAENMGIQPTTNQHYCAPKEINEFFQATNGMTVMDAIKKEVEEQNQRENLGKKNDS